MTTEQTTKVNKLLTIIETAEVIVVGDSPYLKFVDVSDTNGDSDNEVIRASWDEDGLGYNIKFTEGALAEAKIVSGSIFVNDTDGDEVQISLYNLNSINIEVKVNRSL